MGNFFTKKEQTSASPHKASPPDLSPCSWPPFGCSSMYCKGAYMFAHVCKLFNLAYKIIQVLVTSYFGGDFLAFLTEGNNFPFV